MRIIVFAIFVIALSTLALFSGTDVITMLNGSHTTNSLTSDANDVECVGCHQRMSEQLDNSAIHSNFGCEECHRLTRTADGEVVKYATHNQSGVTVGNESHAAYTPRCLDCHGEDGVYYNDTWVQKQAPTAIAFNETGYGSDYSAHKPFVEQALEWGLSKGENEACIACHTNYSMEIEYKYWYDIDYYVSNWNVPFNSFSVNGTREYDITYNKSGYKHEFVNSDDINCVTCHKNIYDALVNGTEGDNEDYLTHSPIEIDSDEWDTYNPWGHYRYHYIDSNRVERVNNTYCFECHNIKKYANNNPSEDSTYNLSDVTSDTNSTSIHAAEALWCQTCHGTGKTKEVIDNKDYDRQNRKGHNQTDFVDEIKNYYARTFHGDICMGCHEAAVHGNRCKDCHELGEADVYIESEPSGYASNT
ncbi:MAG: hypothetical protein ACLFVX_04155 [Archaeoglobaceae archaeon]